MVLETARVILRPFADGDAGDVYAYASDPRVGPAAGWEPHRAAAESLAAIRGPLSALFAVVPRATGRVIGSAGFLERGPGCVSNELGFALHPDWWGRGIGTEVCRRLVRHGFGDLGFAEIWCACAPDNLRCRRLLEKCAFLPVFRQELLAGGGRAREVCFYVRLRREEERDG